VAQWSRCCATNQKVAGSILLLCTLENNIAGIQIGQRRIKTTVLAYAMM
jgi:hypothetical protein